MARGDDAPFSIAVRSFGVGVLAPLLWLLPAIEVGGLAPLALAGGIAALIGVPTALAEWRAPVPGDRRLSALRESGAEVVGMVALALALISVDRSRTGLLLAVSAWPLGAVLAQRPRLQFLTAALALVLAGCGVGFALQVAAPTTLLEPQWAAYPRWIGAALLAGALLAGAGSGQWRVGGARVPGQRRAPWAALGLGLSFAVLVATARGARFEALLEGDSAWVTGGCWFALFAASGSISTRTSLAPRARVVTGIALTLGLASVGAAGVALLTFGAVPIAAALLLAPLVRGSGSSAVAPAFAVIACAIGAWVSWPGVPASVADAAGVAAIVVVAFWFLATRAVLAQRQAT